MKIRLLKYPENIYVNNYFCILLLAVSATFCILPYIFHQTLFVGHDIKFHLFQSAQFYKSLASGNLMPKWALDANNGYGSANFLFYSPLSYYVVSLLHSFIPSIISSIIAAIWSSFFLSGVSIFLMVRKVTGNTISLLCAFLYQILPFHTLDLYLRGTLGELFGFIWLPLIFSYFNDILSGNKSRSAFIGLSVSYAGLILTHLVSAFIVSIIISIYLIISTYYISDKRCIFNLIGSVALGLGLASYFITPIFFEMSFIKIDYIHKYAFANYRNNFLFQINTMYSDLFKIKATNNVVGILNITVVLELLIFLILVVVLFKITNRLFEDRYLIFSVYMFLLSFFMSTPLSKWLWDLLPPLNSIQFPWRWVTFMEMALIFLIAIFLNEAKNNKNLTKTVKFRCTVYVLSTLVLISIFTIFISNHELPKQIINKILFPEKYGYYTELPREYTPVWATDLGRRLSMPAPNRVTVVSGTAIAQPVSWQPEKRIINVEAVSPVVLRIATFYYPGWMAESDGKRKQVFIEKKSGTMLINLQPGKHVLTLKFVDTPLRRTAKFLSLISCLILFLYSVRIRTRHE